jgi:hypothetical protein
LGVLKHGLKSANTWTEPPLGRARAAALGPPSRAPHPHPWRPPEFQIKRRTPRRAALFFCEGEAEAQSRGVMASWASRTRHSRWPSLPLGPAACAQLGSLTSSPRCCADRLTRSVAPRCWRCATVCRPPVRSPGSRSPLASSPPPRAARSLPGIQASSPSPRGRSSKAAAALGAGQHQQPAPAPR